MPRSRFRGVTWDSSRYKWKASVWDGRHRNLGRFEVEEEAALAVAGRRLGDAFEAYMRLQAALEEPDKEV